MSTKRSRVARLKGAFRHTATTSTAAPRSRQLGQVLPIFAIMAVVLLAGAALLTDVALWWTHEQRMQRAADAGALAGAIFLPGRPDLAVAAARAETRKNGFEQNVDGVNVSAISEAHLREGGDPRKLLVSIDGPVETNFARALCWDGGPCLRSVDVGVTGAASYVLPVPMGSPQNYYGVGFLKDVVTTTSETDHVGDTMRGDAVSGISGTWTNPQGAYQYGDTYSTDIGASHIWGPFDFSGLPDPLTITGIRVRLGNAEVGGFSTPPDCRVSVRVSWDNGSTWSNPVQSGRLTTSDQTMWVQQSASPSHTWTRAELNSSLRVELTRTGNNADCPSGRQVRVGDLDVQATYDWTQTTTSMSIEEVDVLAPDGTTVLAPHGFWGALQSQGAPNIQGDAYMTYYDTRTSRYNEDYLPPGYYKYAIEFPEDAASDGEIWLFDPGFCHVDSNKGTGEYYTFGSPNGSSQFNRVSTYYELIHTNNTPFNTGDDTVVYSSGADYEMTRWRDTVLDASNPVSADPCDDLEWHNGWGAAPIASNLEGGMTYWLHSYSTPKGVDPASSNQRNTTALNAFAIYASASAGPSGDGPVVHGLGAMEAYVRLPGGRNSEFFLAQIDTEHAGKTLVISLWDPGDTGRLAADLQILKPGPTGWSVEPFSWAAKRNSYNASNCGPDDDFGDFPQDGRDQTDVNFVRTNEGGRSNFNGCWLQITIPLANDYVAHQPDSSIEPGWWKIRYDMSGSTSSYSTDLTTWQVELRGNPVHLVPEG